MMDKPTTQQRLRYWVTPDWKSIRIELPNGLSYSASLHGDDLSWHYGRPADLANTALAILLDGGDAPCSWEHVGFESRQEMERQVAARCVECHVVQPSEDWLSNEGHCGKCFVVQMGAA